MKWLNSLNETTAHNVVGIGLAIIFVLTCLIGDMVGHAVGATTQSNLSTFILVFSGIGAGAFVGKRFSDKGYVAAKASGTTDAPDTAATPPAPPSAP